VVVFVPVLVRGWEEQEWEEFFLQLLSTVAGEAVAGESLEVECHLNLASIKCKLSYKHLQAPNQESTTLPSTRTESSNPRRPSAKCTREHPSPQQFYNALVGRLRRMSVTFSFNHST
jgi:hypothetical protein